MRRKIIDLISSPFKKLKVLYQILIIIGIMIVFSGIQGIMGIYIIRTLNFNAKIVFEKSIKLIPIMRDLQDDFMNLQMNYSGDIVKSSKVSKIMYGTIFEPSITSKINTLKEIDHTAVRIIDKKLPIIKEIMNRPINSDNNKELERIVFEIVQNLKSYTDSLQILAINTATQANNFARFATIITIFLLVVGSVLATVLGFIIALLIARPLRSVRATADALANGDLTKNISAEGSFEVTSVVKSLNKAIGGLRELVGDINEQSGKLFSASQELKDASNNTGKSAMEVAKTMEALAQTSSAQANEVTEVVENINSFSEQVRQVSNELKALAIDSENVAQLAQLGQKATTDVSNEIVKIYNTTKQVNEAIRELKKASEEIDEITTVIEAIAEQTTLLALNASIEAARAGEHGKGFAVVAKETGKLADQSKQSAQHISNLIKQIKNCSEQAVQSISNEMVTVESGKNLTTEAAVTFEKIFTKLGNILARIDSVAVSAKTMAESNDSVILAINNIAAMSEESMSSTEEVSAAAEEQSAMAEQVTALAENLSEIAGKLRQSVAIFKIEFQE